MATKKESISVYLDIVSLIPQLYDDESFALTVMSKQEIRDLIVRNDQQLRSELAPFYGTSLSGTPNISTPIPRYGNTESGVLLVTDGTNDLTISEGSTVYSQVYEIKFTSSTAFSVTSDLTGAQGTGSTASNFTTTDTFLAINSSLWSGSFFAGDVHYIKVYNYEGMLVHMSSLLTANYILNTIFTEESPDASATAEKYDRLYRRLIRSLKNGTVFLEKGLTQRDINPIQVDYEIDQYGRDVTYYEGFDWNPRTGD